MDYRKDIKVYIDEVNKEIKKKNKYAMQIYILCLCMTITMFVLFLLKILKTDVTGEMIAIIISLVAMILILLQIYFTKKDDSSEKIISLLIFGIYTGLNRDEKNRSEDKELYKKILGEIIGRR